MAGYYKNEVLLTDLQCFPNVDYYATLVEYDKLKFEQYVHFKKGSYSNRYYVAGPNGQILLSVPLLHVHRERMAFRDLKICNRDKWQRLHWRTLTSAYRRSPWFEFYEESIQPLYEKKFDYLMDWNLNAFELVNSWLGVSWEVSFTDEYRKKYDQPGIIDSRHFFFPGKLSAENTVQYHQVFEDRTGFLPGMSILDLIFCEGKRSLSLLKIHTRNEAGQRK